MNMFSNFALLVLSSVVIGSTAFADLKCSNPNRDEGSCHDYRVSISKDQFATYASDCEYSDDAGGGSSKLVSIQTDSQGDSVYLAVSGESLSLRSDRKTAIYDSQAEKIHLECEESTATK